MKILAVSDSHGSDGTLERILQREPDCDVLVHLGDGAKDMDLLLRYTAGRQVYFIKGNCDPGGAGLAEKQVFTVEGKKILACHGHRFNVKTGPDALYFEGLKENADICLYGHTHVQAADRAGNMLLLNPGAARSGFYAVIGIADGQIRYELKRL